MPVTSADRSISRKINRRTKHPNVFLNRAQSSAFPRIGGGTYLWEFLVEEGQNLIQLTEKWMFVLISDGMDGESKGSYSGIDGFRSCVEGLQELNIDVEFHIVGLGLPEDACDVFRQVSGSTGGVF